MVPLSTKTLALINKMVSPERKQTFIQCLENKVADNLHLAEDATPFNLERFRFAVIKIAANNSEKFESAIELAGRDWRDLLMAAEFADLLEAHERWADQELARLEN